MKPQRISCKFEVHPDPTAPIELSPFIGMFHRFIQEKSVEGLLIDVADYAHVPNGPGILLVGHDVDYGIDLAEGRAGLLVVRKRYGSLEAADALRLALRSALGAIRAIEEDGEGGVRFSTREVTIQLLDRLACPNDDAHYEAAVAALAPVLGTLYGEKHEISRRRSEDPRAPLTLRVTAQEALSAGDLQERIGGEESREEKAVAPQSQQSAQSPWDISVEELARLRDEGADFVLVDVREPNEFEICHLDGKLIPLGTLGDRVGELDPKAHVVVHCRSGARSAKAVIALRDAGFENAWNVQGGILAWIDRIDPSLTRY